MFMADYNSIKWIPAYKLSVGDVFSTENLFPFNVWCKCVETPSIDNFGIVSYTVNSDPFRDRRGLGQSCYVAIKKVISE